MLQAKIAPCLYPVRVACRASKPQESFRMLDIGQRKTLRAASHNLSSSATFTLSQVLAQNGPVWIGSGCGLRQCSSHGRRTGRYCGAALFQEKSKLSFHLSIASEIHEAYEVHHCTHPCPSSGGGGHESFFLSLTPTHRVWHSPIPQEWIANHGSY
jgi:hypothetical protein